MPQSRDLQYNINDILHSQGNNMGGSIWDAQYNQRDNEGSEIQPLIDTGIAEYGKDFLALNISGKSITIDKTEDIQRAINEINNAGGGTVYLNTGTYVMSDDIILYSKTNLIGAGINQTIIDFNSEANGILMKGSSGNIKVNMKLESFTIQNSGHNAGIDVDYVDFWTIQNVRVTSCNTNGIKVTRAQKWQIINVETDNNTEDGVNISHTTGRNCSDGVILTPYSHDNATGLDIDPSVLRVSIVSGSVIDNTRSGVEVSGTDCTVIGVIATGIAAIAVLGSAKDCAVVGCSSSSTASSTADIVDSDVVMMSNSILDLFSEKDTIYMVNVSAGTLSEGEVCILDPNAGTAALKTRAITTTTTQGDDRVMGTIFVGATTGNFIKVLRQGFTDSLKVNGTTDIAIGDFLGTFTTAGIAMKAAAGDMAFAIALEAYTTDDSNGVIDALIISPRKI